MVVFVKDGGGGVGNGRKVRESDFSRVTPVGRGVVRALNSRRDAGIGGGTGGCEPRGFRTSRRRCSKIAGNRAYLPKPVKSDNLSLSLSLLGRPSNLP